jgi:ankyrin repeat protein
MTKYLLRLNADPKLTFYNRETAVYTAAYCGHAAVVQLLVDAGAEVNRYKSNGWGPLQAAYDSAAVTRILLEAKADPDHVASGEGTALYLASKWNYVEVVQALLKGGAGVNIPSDDRNYHSTPLIVAVGKGNIEVVRLLLEARADINYRRAGGHFALQYARSSEDCLAALLEYNPALDIVDNYSDTALHCIAKDTPLAFIKRLLNAGANPEILNKQGYTPLSVAISKQNIAAAKYLIKRRVMLDFTDGLWGGPLHLACMKASLECIEALVEGDARVNLIDSEVGTPLQAACFRDAHTPEEEEERREIIKYLINAGALPNLQGGQLGFPLNAACLQATPETIKFLIENGADVEVEDMLGRNPAQLASLRTTDPMELFTAEKFRRNFSCRDALGRTALHYAVMSGRLDVVKRAFDLSGQDVDAKADDGWTPLMWAARTCGHWGTATTERQEIIQFLKYEGADLWVRGKGFPRDWSPLKVARYYKAPSEILKMLVPETRQRILDIDGGQEVDFWDSSFHLTMVGQEKESTYCAACLMVRFHSLSTLFLLPQFSYRGQY